VCSAIHFSWKWNGSNGMCMCHISIRISNRNKNKKTYFTKNMSTIWAQELDEHNICSLVAEPTLLLSTIAKISTAIVKWTGVLYRKHQHTTVILPHKARNVLFVSWQGPHRKVGICWRNFGVRRARGTGWLE
jgi:hypothetical protein